MLVVAGAGTGKTSVLIHRIARLVEQGHAKPEEVLALTYTVAAAGEMRDRVRGLLGKPIHSATFHDYCLDLLKRAGKDFGVLDEKDLWIYLRKRIHELHLEHYIRAANVGQFLNDLLGFLSRCHDELVTPEKYAEYVARLERGETAGSPGCEIERSVERCRGHRTLPGNCPRVCHHRALAARRKSGHVRPHDHACPRPADQRREVAGCRARPRPFHPGRRISGCQLRADQNSRGAGGSRSERLRRRRSRSGHLPLSRSIQRGVSSCSAGIFLNRSWSCSTRTGARPLRFCDALLPWSTRTLPCLPRTTQRACLPAHSSAVGARRRSEERRKDTGHFPRRSDLFCRQEMPKRLTWPASSKRRNGARVAGGRTSAFSTARTFIAMNVVQELAEREIPFSIENMDVSDTPEVRDLFACVAVVVDLSVRRQSFSRSRVAAVRCGSRATSDGAARDCKRFEGRSRDSACLGARPSCRRPRRAWSPCARRATKSAASRLKRTPLCN